MYQSFIALYHTHVMYKMHMNTNNRRKDYTKLIFRSKKN